MKQTTNLINQLLVAMPSMRDATFNKSVVYIYEHGDNGALGMIINKPMNIDLGSVMSHLEIKMPENDLFKLPVLMGGPVSQEHGFILYRNPPTSKKPESIEVSASKETLEAIANDKGPDDFIVTLGYAGWSPGQLEEEIIRSDWLIVPADLNLLFHTPVQDRWRQSAESIGVDLNKISTLTGFA